MHPRVDRLPRPDPDYRDLLAAIRRQRPRRVPLIELAVDHEVVTALLDEPAATTSCDADLRRVLTRRMVRLLHRMGYDAVKVSAAIPFGDTKLVAKDSAELSRGRRLWQDEHGGVIADAAACAAFPWPTLGDIDFGPVAAAVEALPDGMAILGFAGGVLEFAVELVGLERFMYAMYDQPELLAAVIDRVGRTVLMVFEAYCRIEQVRALWLGDDLGSKNGLLVSPAFLREHVFPWYARYAALAHENGRPFVLHSCGRVESVMDDIVAAGVDAKHSFEDAIQPVEHFADTWGSQVGVLGGIDVNLLATGDEAAVAARVRQVLERCAPRGGYACGSGNSITNYVPPANYLAMVEAVHAFNGR
jgi:uroporphyrinogen decarboxylase